MKVNVIESQSTRARLLSILRNTDLPVSGEMVAAGLGISRVAVWKAVKTLNANGYRIDSSSSGYRLEADLSDSICPWEFGADENRFRHWEETDSTMDRAREAAMAGADAGLVVTAESQSAGRGTGAKKWESVPGGLFFTVLTRPTLNAAYSIRQVLAAQLALSRAITKLTGKQASPLWPNDILYDGGKAGGILAETLATGSTITWLNLGIGLNTGRRPSLPGSSAIRAGRKELLREFLAEFAKIDTEGSDLASSWNGNCPLTGETIRFRQLVKTVPGSGQTGIFRGVDEAGWAKIETTDHSSLPEENRFPPNTITMLDKGYET